MRRFAHYLLKDFTKLFVLSLGAFTGLYLLVDFFEKVDDFLKANATVGHYLVFFGCKAPVIAQQLMPMAVLMATFMTLAGLSRTSELTAMRAVGMSISKLALPLLSAGLLLSLISLAMTEYLTPLLATQAFKVREIELGKQGTKIYRHHNVWLRTKEGVIQIRLADPEKNMLHGIRTFTLGDTFQLSAYQQAATAHFQGKEWDLEKNLRYIIDPDTGGVVKDPDPPTTLQSFNRTPEDFSQARLETDQFSLSGLWNTYRQYRAEGLNSRRLLVDLNARLASPFTCFIMAFLGVPFALQKGRKSGVATGMVISALVGITYFVLQAVITAFGYSGALPAVLAAWSGNLLFLLFGGWLLINVRE